MASRAAFGLILPALLVVWILCCVTFYTPAYKRLSVETFHYGNDTGGEATLKLPASCQIKAKARVHRLQAWCKTNARNLTDIGKGIINLDHLYVNDKFKVVYCRIPKTGCTNWKKYFILLSGTTNYTHVHDIKSPDAHSELFERSVRTLSSYTLKERKNILNTYFKFVVVRNPLTRLLSAYRNKIEKINPTFNGYRRKMLKYNNRLFNNTFQKRVGFEEFLHYISRPDATNTQANDHWKSYQELCHPCSIQYDFIGQVETMAEDSRYIIERIGAHYKFPEQESTSDSHVTYRYSKVSRDVVRKVISKYKDDINFFGYSC